LVPGQIKTGHRESSSRIER